MELISIICLVLVFIYFLGKSRESGDFTKLTDQELLKYRHQFEMRIRLCVKAGKDEEKQKYLNKIGLIDIETNRRERECSIETGTETEFEVEVVTFAHKYADFVVKTMATSGCTEEAANLIFTKAVDEAVAKYKERGLDPNIALEKSVDDVFNSI